MKVTTCQSKVLIQSFGRNFVVACVLTLASLLAGISASAHASQPGLCWVDCGDEKLCLQERGEAVMTFQLAPTSFNGKFSRANYVHPLHDPSGDIVTEDFPKDHRHHRGIFWAWHQLLLNGKPTSDPWACTGIEWKVPETEGDWAQTHADARSATMRVVRDWVVADPNTSNPAATSPDSADHSLRLARETVGITVWPSTPNVRILDFDLRLRALKEGVSIGGSDDVKGYGGFSPRVKLASDVKFVGRKGEVTPQRLAAVEGGPWIDVVGTFDGKRKGTVMMVHPSHPGFPLKWILRPKGSMQNPQWPGREPVELSTQTDIRLRYRVVLHTGELDREAIESIWSDFAATADRNGQSHSVVTQNDVVYSTPGEESLQLDVYQPQGEGPFSAVLVVHGGAWRKGNRKQLGFYAEALARRGHCCFAISYRLAPKHKFPAQIKDCRAAVGWIRKNADKYHVDPARLGAIGYSAGGHLVALLATTGEAPSAKNNGVDTRLQAVAAGGAPTEFRVMPDGGEGLAYWLGGNYKQQKKNFEDASPAMFASTDDAPTLFFNGTDDSLVPLVRTRPLYLALKQEGVPTVLHEVEGAGHMKAMSDNNALNAAYDFLDKHLAK